MKNLFSGFSTQEHKHEWLYSKFVKYLLGKQATYRICDTCNREERYDNFRQAWMLIKSGVID